VKRAIVPKGLPLVGLTFLLLAAGCRGETSKETPFVGIRNMFDQPKYSVQSQSDFFDDHRTMRPVIEGVVAREAEIDPRVASGRLEDDSGYVLTIPQGVVDRAGGMDKLLTRGQGRYGIYCSPCHDKTGRGEGMVAKRAARIPGAAAMAPTNLHKDTVRHMPDGQLFTTITNGVRNMPAYGQIVPVPDRWAIVAYVRALEVSQASQNPEAPPTGDQQKGQKP
jgi:mono/diheme cytochrome c family protein